ncbi:24-hydroxycholesterol 7-alpha-hydroxylase [Trichosurus vulpecula]|uniref:24-hydroxycholesterol 7-alpha-hydroxylase n=1 Tax=Trichosurus vulpecula TaxID=9337 RepID=UPI00186B4041|nr:24-hydroxycholesterol 7-alpha-hydroxylase [Trichosurus vulpecula]
MDLFLMSFAIILGCTAFYLYHQQRNTHRPPCVGGWIPWIGAMFQFGKAPLEFIEQARIKYGPVFTIFVLGNRITFVTEEEGFDIFFKSKEVNFEHAVEDHVYRTVSVPKSTFLTFHGLLYGLLKNKMKISHLYQFSEKLVEGLHEELQSLGTDGSEDLCNFVRRALYPVTVNIIFGKGLYPTTQEKIQEFNEHFQIYDDGFQYGSQIPECFLRKWSKSKRWLLNLFEKSIPDLERDRTSGDPTVLQLITNTLRHGTKPEKAPNYCVLMLWASLSNAVPVAYWTVIYILYNPPIYKNIMEGISSVFGEAGKNKIEISENDLKKIPLIKWCVLETTRLVAPGIIARKVIKPVKISNYTVPSGDLLMLSPFWTHRNPKYFPEPESFKPERWEKADLEKNAFLDWFVAFGGGKYPCPGRWLALLEIEIFVALVFYKYQFNLLDPFPKENFNQLVGVQKLSTPCRVEYKCRK